MIKTIMGMHDYVDDSTDPDWCSFQSKTKNNVLYLFEPLSYVLCGRESVRVSLCDFDIF